MLKLKHGKLTEDTALFPCLDKPLEADFGTFELLFEVGPIETALADSNDIKERKTIRQKVKEKWGEQ